MNIIKKIVKTSIWIIAMIGIFIGVQLFRTSDIVGTVPPWQMQQLNGTQITSPNNAKYVIHFFSEWCPVCRTEYDNFINLPENHTVINVATFVQDKQALYSFLNDNNYPLNVGFDSNSQLAQKLGVQGVPTTLFVDENGKIIHKATGYTPTWLLRFLLLIK